MPIYISDEKSKELEMLYWTNRDTLTLAQLVYVQSKIIDSLINKDMIDNKFLYTVKKERVI